MNRPQLKARAERILRDWTVPVCLASAVFLVADTAFAQASSPWETAATRLKDAFVGPIARCLALVAIVVGGLIFAYGEGQGKKALAGIVFGLGMALGAVQFMNWLFPTANVN